MEHRSFCLTSIVEYETMSIMLLIWFVEVRNENYDDLPAGILLVSPQVCADLSVSDLENIESIVKDSEARIKN